MRVAPRWRGARIGHITDIEAFVPGEEPVVPADDGGAADGAGHDDGLQRLHHLHVAGHPERGARRSRPTTKVGSSG